MVNGRFLEMNPARRPLLKTLLVNLPGFPDENHARSCCYSRFFTRSLHSLVRIKTVCSAHILAQWPWQIPPPKKAPPACCRTGQLGGHDPDGEYGGEFCFD
jgi:hypothetical protein